ncbi:MAG TPA: methyltransferase domain-containing protein [Aquihabitans sp.]|jgi:SAM-dependent methyltransferase|nr:methyltransferase domain-containing protein [Aquihabitans sp.]
MDPHDHDRPHEHPHHGDHQHGHDHGPDLSFTSPEMVAFAELEGEVLAGMAVGGIGALAEQAERQGLDVRRVLDVGAGPGVGTCLLAERFASADVLAVDASAAMLERAAARAERLGVGDRVDTRELELPTGLEGIEPVDVAWASMSLHHVGDEVAALRAIHDVLVSGGLLALVEAAGPVRVLPSDVDLDRPGLWERIDAGWEAWFAAMRRDLPGATPSADHATMLRRAGFELVAQERLDLALDPPLDDRARRLAHRHLSWTRTQLASYAEEGDREVLDRLLDDADEASILRRGDARVQTSRRLVLARAASQR